MSCDVLIIGAGPAGASLAYFLSLCDCKTILVEKKKVPDFPVRCAELVSKNLFSLFREKVKGINSEISSMQTYINGKMENEIPSPSVMLDREVFIDSLIQIFIKNGGIFLNPASFNRIISFNKNKKEINPDDFIKNNFANNDTLVKKEAVIEKRKNIIFNNNSDSVNAAVFKKDTDKSIAINAKIIACAEGFSGKLRGIIDKASFREDSSSYVLAYQETIKKKNKYSDKAMIFFYPYIANGYGWVFPKRDTLNVGIGMGISDSNQNKENLQDRYNMFKKDIRTSGFISGGEKLIKNITGTAPCRGIRYPVSFLNFVFAGDAAGLCNPVTGAGIYNAVLSSKIISDNISGFLKTGDYNMLEEINQKIKSYFSSSIERALKKRQEINKYWPGSDFERLIRRTWVSFKDYWKK